MFESGATVQVLKKGVFFASRANRLLELYRRYSSLDEIDEASRKQIQEKYFQRSFDEVWRETRDYYLRTRPEVVEMAERNPKGKMALVFRWYFIHSNRLAMRGDPEQRVNYQVNCGPALGAFNQWVKGTPLESWRNRNVDEIAEMLMRGAAAYLDRRFRELGGLDGAGR
jgi:trans-AT polyketide synthase/acyltransferase/oxidoreductase domain-containing protein